MAKKSSERWAVVTSQYRDLYYGKVVTADADIIKNKAATVEQCRHIGYWKGPVGGLSGLAAEGPGPGSRIGAPNPSSLLTGVAHVHDVTEAARAKFDALAPSAG
jgi:hypothetical protein